MDNKSNVLVGRLGRLGIEELLLQFSLVMRGDHAVHCCTTMNKAPHRKAAMQYKKLLRQFRGLVVEQELVHHA